MTDDRNTQTSQEPAAEPAPVEPPVEPPVPVEPPAEPQAPVEPVLPAEPVAGTDGAPASPAAPSRRTLARRLVGTVLPAVLVLGAAGGGIAYTKNTVDRADKTAPTTVWKKTAAKPDPDPAGDIGKGRTDTDLSRKLLPVPDGFRLGPDIGEFGNDDELTAKQATTLMKSIGEGLSGKIRRELNKEIDKLGVKGLASRSYTADSNDLVAEIYVMRITDREAVHNWYKSQSQRPGTRKGPAVEGHKKAACFLAPKNTKTDLDGMECVAYDGELTVHIVAYGTKPLDTSAVADLMKDQLGHIASPGKYI
ncbi:hypothetical protein [Streptomyces sp. AK02-01A]|uniref:hypothetical protein n=1 Tax=Streptomyces sp. AK02-01A TaxID=3028648 RepID=UPI0029BCCB14|nr:hypothetical protein [Streptomyces sp. AK02-01A]MDX3853267.1 hypothetical protein [Streptomyces sp. AK02-01A]